MRLKLQLCKVDPVLKSSADNRISFYVRAARYHRLLYFVADRVLGNPDRAVIAVENCLFWASRHFARFDDEGEFRNWLVRLALEESLAIFHGRNMPEHRREDEAGEIRIALLPSR
jgi:DNA-directed RNA polymerase specialized sigma24 family protein